MQIFVTGTAYQTALDLDRKRLSNQITEARITLDCLMGKNKWDRHPLIKMYRGYAVWIELTYFSYLTFIGIKSI